MSDNEDRRKNDEQFKLRVVEQMAKIEVMLKNVEGHMQKLEDSTTTNALKIYTVEAALVGDIKTGQVGLLEKVRDLAKKWAIAMAIIAFVGNLLGFMLKEYVKNAIKKPVYSVPVVKPIKKSKKQEARRIEIPRTPLEVAK